MGLIKKMYEDWLIANDDEQLKLEVEKAIDNIIDYRNFEIESHTKVAWDNACRHEKSDVPMALYGLPGLHYYCKKCGHPMDKFIPYEDRD